MIAFALNYSKAALPQRNMAETAEAQILRRKRKIQGLNVKTINTDRYFSNPLWQFSRFATKSIFFVIIFRRSLKSFEIIYGSCRRKFRKTAQVRIRAVNCHRIPSPNLKS
jgi:hypothetical protein